MDTTVGALKVGTQLVMGKYGVDKDSPHPIVWLKGNPNCDFITEKAIDYLCFDAAEETGHYRRVNNAKYPVSNLFSFLNSDQMMWYHAMHDNDSSPGAFVRYSYARYEDHYGFLYFFEDHEIASLVRKEYVVGENRVSSLIRLPSIADIFSLQDGRRFDLFKRKGIRPNPTADLFDLKARYAGLDSDRGFMSFWLLDDVETERAAISNRSGVLNRLTASSCSGVRPVCTLSPDTIVEQREDGVFFIKPFTRRMTRWNPESKPAATGRQHHAIKLTKCQALFAKSSIQGRNVLTSGSCFQSQ